MGSSRRPRRRTVAIAVVLVIGIVFGVGTLLEPTTSDSPDVERVDESDLIQPAENGSYLWPYTSGGKTVTKRTLAINLIVHGPDDAVRRSLTDRGSLDFEREVPTEEPSTEQSVVGDGLAWADAHGARRYSYVDATPRGGDVGWRTETYQLRAGTYLGERLHVRAYTHPDENWTAIQAHTDYWDWFRLRHTVPDAREAGLEIESDYIEEQFVAEVRREYYGIEGGRSDGWVSVIELSSDVDRPEDAERTEDADSAGNGTDDSTALEEPRAAGVDGTDPEDDGAVVGLLATLALLGLLGTVDFVSSDTRRALDQAGRALLREASRRRRSILLGVVLAGIVLGVRIVGIAVETAVPALHPKSIAAVLYPILALGLPAAVVRLARGTEPAWAVTFVAVGVGTAFVVDFGMVSVSLVPVRLVLHRFGLLLALALVAAGSAMGDDRGRTILAAGLAAWFVGLVLPLANLI